MADVSPLLAGASAPELARLQEWLDGLPAQDVQPLGGLQSALAQLQTQSRNGGRDAGFDAMRTSAPTLPGARPEASALGLVAIGTANALLLQEHALAATSAPVTGDASPAAASAANTDMPAQLDIADAHALPLPATLPVSEADWAAAGAQDHAMLAALGVPMASLMGDMHAADSAPAVRPDASPEAVASLHDALHHVETQLASLGHDMGALFDPVQPHEISAAAEALGAQPLPALLAGTSEAASAFQDHLQAAQVHGDAAPLLDLVPGVNVAPVLDLLEQVPAVVEHTVDAITGVLDHVATAVGEVLVPLAEHAGELLHDVASALPALVDTLLPGTDNPLHAPVAEVVDVVSHVVDAAGQALTPVAHAVDTLVSGVSGGLAELVDGVLHPGSTTASVPLVDEVLALAGSSAASSHTTTTSTASSEAAAASSEPAPAVDHPLTELPSLGAAHEDVAGLLHGLTGLLKPGG